MSCQEVWVLTAVFSSCLKAVWIAVLWYFGISLPGSASNPVSPERFTCLWPDPLSHSAPLNATHLIGLVNFTSQLTAKIVCEQLLALTIFLVYVPLIPLTNSVPLFHFSGGVLLALLCAASEALTTVWNPSGAAPSSVYRSLISLIAWVWDSLKSSETKHVSKLNMGDVLTF